MVLNDQELKNLPIFDRDIVGTLSRFLDASALGTGGATLVVDGMEARKVGVSPSAIQQVKINQDPYSAEFPRPGRGRIEVITKAGTDKYHGSMDFTFRDAQLNARDPFADTRPPEQRRIYEGVLGGPVRDGKHTSFLFTLERREEDLQSIVFAAGPAGPIHAIVPRSRTAASRLSASLNHQQGKRHTLRSGSPTRRRSTRNQGVGGTTLPEVGRRRSRPRGAAHLRRAERPERPAAQRVPPPGRARDRRRRVSLHPGRRVVVLDAFTAGGAQADQRTTEYHFKLTETLTYVHGKHLFKAGFADP